MQKTLQILVLEDAACRLEAISKELRQAGIAHVAKNVNSRAGLAASLAEFRTDLVVAGREGLADLPMIGKQDPDLPVIFVLDSAHAAAGPEAIQRGGADYVLLEHPSQIVPAVARAMREAEERKQRRRAEMLLELRYQQLSIQNQAVQESEERFRQLAESIREVFWMTDLERAQILYVSPAYEEIWGRSRASLYEHPRDWLDAVHPEDRERTLQVTSGEKSAMDYDIEYRIARPDGSTRWIHDRAFPVRDEAGATYRIAGVAEDVTNRKHLEKQILEISDREQERIGRDLHDELCQLLVSIGFNANNLKQDLLNRSPADVAAADRIAHKISQAIKVARDLAHGLCPVDFQKESLTTALQNLARSVTEDFGIACAAECDAAPPLTNPTAASHVYRIAREAVHNAVKHATPTRISIRLGAKDGRMLLTVTDDGVGISARPQPGPGLGLEIMKYRASMLCGALDIRPANAVGRPGAEISCVFPPPITA